MAPDVRRRPAGISPRRLSYASVVLPFYPVRYPVRRRGLIETVTTVNAPISGAKFAVVAALKKCAADLFELETGVRRILPMEGLRGMSAALVFFVHFYALFGSYAAGGRVRSSSSSRLSATAVWTFSLR